MNQRVPLFAHGTARTLFEASDRGAIEEFFRRLAIGAAQHDLGDDSLYLCEELVRLPWSLSPGQRRSLALLVLATFIAARQGSSRLPLGGGKSGYLGQIISGVLKVAATGDSAARVVREISALARDSRFDALIGGPDSDRPLIHANGCIYQQRLHASERRLARVLLQRIATYTQESDRLREALADVAARPPERAGVPLTLSEEQLAAASRALCGGFAVISGGPGTGKTATVASILRAGARLGIKPADMRLAAPTGKAAQRLGDSLRAGLSHIGNPSAEDVDLRDGLPPPETLHRFLGYVPSLDQFHHHEGNPIRAGLVLVDEASMIDLGLMEHLVRSLAPATPLVLLGDSDQLPSVDAGSVFRDLVTLGGEDQRFGRYARRLTKSYRMDRGKSAGNAIYLAAQAVVSGNASQTEEWVVRRNSANLDWSGVEIIAGEADSLLAQWYRRHRQSREVSDLASRVYVRTDGRFALEDQRRIRRLFELYNGSRILTVTRRLARGSTLVNSFLHRLALAESTTDQSPDFLPGCAIQATKNDYRRGIYNGDQGIVLRVDEEGHGHHFRAVFPNGDQFSVYHLDALRAQIEHASAITVHKSQGSEYDEVTIVLPDEDLPLLTRELLYTAITRARSSVVIFGRPSLVANAIRRQTVRFSGVVELLRP